MFEYGEDGAETEAMKLIDKGKKFKYRERGIDLENSIHGIVDRNFAKNTALNWMVP